MEAPKTEKGRPSGVKNRLSGPTPMEEALKALSKAAELKPRPTFNAVKKDVERQKRLERITLIVTIAFTTVVAFAAWYTDGRIFSSAWNTILSFEAPGHASRNAALNCQNPKNKNTPYCVERTAEAGAMWESISRYTDGKGNAFTLHGRRN